MRAFWSMLQRSFAAYYGYKEESAQAVEVIHDLCDRIRQSTFSCAGQAVYPQNFLCLVRIICNPLHNVVNDVAPRVFKTGCVTLFVHMFWFSGFKTCLHPRWKSWDNVRRLNDYNAHGSHRRRTPFVTGPIPFVSGPMPHAAKLSNQNPSEDLRTPCRIWLSDYRRPRWD